MKLTRLHFQKGIWFVASFCFLRYVGFCVVLVVYVGSWLTLGHINTLALGALEDECFDLVTLASSHPYISGNL